MGKPHSNFDNCSIYVMTFRVRCLRSWIACSGRGFWPPRSETFVFSCLSSHRIVLMGQPFLDRHFSLSDASTGLAPVSVFWQGCRDLLSTWQEFVPLLVGGLWSLHNKYGICHVFECTFLNIRQFSEDTGRPCKSSYMDILLGPISLSTDWYFPTY